MSPLTQGLPSSSKQRLMLTTMLKISSHIPEAFWFSFFWMAVTTCQAQDETPNILFRMTDQQRSTTPYDWSTTTGRLHTTSSGRMSSPPLMESSRSEPQTWIVCQEKGHISARPTRSAPSAGRHELPSVPDAPSSELGYKSTQWTTTSSIAIPNCFRIRSTNWRVSTRFWSKNTGTKPSITASGTFHHACIIVETDRHEWWDRKSVV